MGEAILSIKAVGGLKVMGTKRTYSVANGETVYAGKYVSKFADTQDQSSTKVCGFNGIRVFGIACEDKSGGETVTVIVP